MSNSNSKKFLEFIPFILLFLTLFFLISFLIKVKLNLREDNKKNNVITQKMSDEKEKSVFISNLASAMYIAEEDEKRILAKEYSQDLSVFTALKFENKKIDSIYFYFGENIYDHQLGFRRADIFILIFSDERPRWVYLSDYEDVYLDSVETFKVGEDTTLKIEMEKDSVLSQKLIDKSIVKELEKRLEIDSKISLKGKTINLKNMSILD